MAYSLSSPLFERLQGSEIARLKMLYENDYEWGSRGPIITKLPNQRIILEVWPDIAPLACQNFLTIVKERGQQGEPLKMGKSGVKLTYKNCPFHRIVTDFIAQTGDFVSGTGTAGESIWGKKFKTKHRAKFFASKIPEKNYKDTPNKKATKKLFWFWKETFKHNTPIKLIF